MGSDIRRTAAAVLRNGSAWTSEGARLAGAIGGRAKSPTKLANLSRGPAAAVAARAEYRRQVKAREAQR